MFQITYTDMVMQHGEVKALELLRTVENLANIQDTENSAGEEARFNRALEALTKIDFSTFD